MHTLNVTHVKKAEILGFSKLFNQNTFVMNGKSRKISIQYNVLRFREYHIDYHEMWCAVHYHEDFAPKS